MRQPESSAWKRFPRWLEVLFLLVLPPLTFWLLNFRQVHQANSLDPFFYTGYINNAEDLLRRFGLLYYAVRFGLILPGRFFTWAFGAEPGYFAFRYALALTAGVPFYLFARRLFNLPTAILAYVSLMVSPWFARTLLWDHPDAAGVPYLLAAMSMLLLGRKPSWVRDGAAGVCASMAVNSNIFTTAILGIFGAVYVAALLLYGTTRRTLLKRGIRFGAGFVLVLAAGYGYYWSVLGMPRNIFKPSIDTALGLSLGGMAQYRTAGVAWLFRVTHVLVPVLLAVCCLLAVVRRQMRFEIAVCSASGIAVVAFFYVHQFLLNGDTLEFSYYFSYALPTTFLMLVCLWHALRERGELKSGVFLGVGLGATLLPALQTSAAFLWLERMKPAQWGALAAATVVAVALARVAWNRQSARTAASLCALVLLAFSVAAGFVSSANYQITRPFRLHEDSEGDQYRVAIQLIRETPKLSQGPGNVLFWYNNRTNNPINSVQSTYIWGASKMNRDAPEDPGMPHIGNFQMEQLRSLDVRYLILLGETPAEIPAGLQALTKAGAGYDLLSTRDLHSGAMHVYWQLVELTKRPPQ
ncbi:MAG: hypothetical protein ABI806_05605 [Candidatus Solibacter sp.]